MYPSGRVVSYTYDNAGRPSSLTGQPAGGSATNYASSMIYHPHGAVEQMLLGNNKLEQSCYNSRLQPVGMRLSSGTSPTTDCANSSDLLNLAFGYGTSNNNGNVLSQTITMPKQTSGTLTVQQAYGYDGVNRLASAGETVTAGGSGGGAWSFNHGYDQFGNMWVSSTTGLAAHSATPRAVDQFGATTNRLTKAFDGSTLSNPYDEAGNLINHPYVGAMQYDAENRQKQFTSGSTTATYHYDGDGRRVKRVLGGQTTVYVYDAFGMLAAEYSTATPTETGGRRYRTTDHLGSTRLVTNSTGAVVSRHDYVPFGEELPASSSAGNRNLVFGFGVSPSERHKFTGKERDVESGLDYFGARYMSAVQGRFTSPDRPFADQHLEDPQSWNLYGYVRNNPLANIDPSGEACSSLIGNTGSGYCQRADVYANFDALVHNKTRFFAAASAATQALANVAVPGLGRVGTSPETRAFLESTGQVLLSVNTEAVGRIISGQMSGSGPDLDARMVHLEQTTVQKGLDDLKRTDPGAYSAAVKEINGLLNSKAGVPANALAALSGVFLPTDGAYAQVLAGVRKSLGHDINFANQKDREAIGNALVKHVRETGGCDVAGDKAHGCR